jgi:hypothetical protein
MTDPYINTITCSPTCASITQQAPMCTCGALNRWIAAYSGDPMQEHIHVPADYEDHIHQPAWNEPSRNAGPKE